MTFIEHGKLMGTVLSIEGQLLDIQKIIEKSRDENRHTVFLYRQYGLVSTIVHEMIYALYAVVEVDPRARSGVFFPDSEEQRGDG